MTTALLAATAHTSESALFLLDRPEYKNALEVGQWTRSACAHIELVTNVELTDSGNHEEDENAAHGYE